jgi:hypothetical protein
MKRRALKKRRARSRAYNRKMTLRLLGEASRRSCLAFWLNRSKEMCAKLGANSVYGKIARSDRMRYYVN